MKNINGQINGIKYSISQSLVDTLKKLHNIDALTVIDKATKQGSKQ